MPLLTNIELWLDAVCCIDTEINGSSTTHAIPDLFVGAPLVVSGKYRPVLTADSTGTVHTVLYLRVITSGAVVGSDDLVC